MAMTLGGLFQGIYHGYDTLWFLFQGIYYCYDIRWFAFQGIYNGYDTRWFLFQGIYHGYDTGWFHCTSGCDHLLLRLHHALCIPTKKKPRPPGSQQKNDQIWR